MINNLKGYVHKNTDPEISPNWEKTEYLCRGDSFRIWVQHAKQNKDNKYKEDRGYLIDWEEHQGAGESLTVGWLDNRPINLQISWAKLDGYLIGFYYPCSQLVDWAIIDEWLDNNFFKLYGKNRRDHHENEMNFFNIVRHYRRTGS